MKLNFWMYIRQDKKNDFHSLPLYNALFFSSPFSISVTCSLFLPHPTLRGLFVYFKKLLLVQKLGSSSKYKYIAEEDKGGQAGLLVSPRKRADAEPWSQPCLGAAACSGPRPGELPLPAPHQQQGMGSFLTNPFPEAVSELC